MKCGGVSGGGNDAGGHAVDGEGGVVGRGGGGGMQGSQVLPKEKGTEAHDSGGRADRGKGEKGGAEKDEGDFDVGRRDARACVAVC